MKLFRDGSELTYAFYIKLYASSSRSSNCTMLHFPASQPEGKIFALLGYSGHDERISIVPDYSKSVTDVYISVAENLLSSRENGCFILSNAGIGYPQRLMGLPSWISDWRAIYSSLPIHRLVRQRLRTSSTKIAKYAVVYGRSSSPTCSS